MPQSTTTSSSSEILDAALEYVDMGFSVIPVRRADKKSYVKWEKFQRNRPTRSEIEAWWTQWPDANVAIICGRISHLFCVDADGPAGQEWIDKNLPRTGVYSITAKGVHALYRPPENTLIKNRVRLAPEVDIRGEGGYFVAPPSIHANGHVYEWRFILNGWDNLAEYAPADPRKDATLKEHGNLNLDLSLSELNAQLDIDALFDGIDEGSRDITLFRYACSLRGKNLDERDAWSLLKEKAKLCKPSFTEKEAFEKLRSAWRYSSNEAREIATAKEVNFDRCVIPKNPAATPILKSILHPGGLLEDLMNLFDRNSAVSHPLFNLAGAIALLGNVAGQKVQTQSGLRTNFYAIAIGYSGSGKNAPISVIPNILELTAAYPTLGPDEITSHAAVLAFLKQAPVALMILDEFGDMIRSLKNPNSAASQFPRLIKSLFSKTNGPYTKPYTTREHVVLPYHHLSIYGASTPDEFWGSLTFNEVTSGVLARLLIFSSEHDAPNTITQRIQSEIPDSIVSAIDAIYALGPPRIGGNLNGRPDSFKIMHSFDAFSALEEWGMKYSQLGNATKRDADGSSSIYRRAKEHALKLSLLHSISLRGASIVEGEVGLESVMWAMELVDALVESTVYQLKRNICANDIDQWRQKIVHIVECESKYVKSGRPGPGAVKSDFYNNTRGLTDFVFKQAMDGLLEAGTLDKVSFAAKNGKVCDLYYFPPKDNYDEI